MANVVTLEAVVVAVTDSEECTNVYVEVGNGAKLGLTGDGVVFEDDWDGGSFGEPFGAGRGSFVEADEYGDCASG